MPKANRDAGYGHVHLQSTSNENLLVTPWVPLKSDSLLDKFWGHQIQLRVTLEANKFKIDEVALPRLVVVWQNFYGRLAALWGGKPRFSALPIGGMRLGHTFTTAQKEYVKKILVDEDIDLMQGLTKEKISDVHILLTSKESSVKAADLLGFFAIAHGLTDKVKASVQEKFPLSAEEDRLAYEKHVDDACKLIQSMVSAEGMNGDDAQWTAVKAAIHVLAKDYFGGDEQAFMSKHAPSILERIHKVLEKKAFQRDPAGYMAAWRVRRGNTEEYRIPEDAARYFLERIF